MSALEVLIAGAGLGGLTLAQALRGRKVADGQLPLADALSAYERDMTAYGFSVVREATRIGEARMAQNPLPA